MRVYLDLCCLNRPFDDQRQIRIRLESEAVLAVLDRAARGEIVWLSSEAIELEASRNSDADRLERVLLIACHATETLPLTRVISGEQRASSRSASGRLTRCISRARNALG